MPSKHPLQNESDDDSTCDDEPQIVEVKNSLKPPLTIEGFLQQIATKCGIENEHVERVLNCFKNEAVTLTSVTKFSYQELVDMGIPRGFAKGLFVPLVSLSH